LESLNIKNKAMKQIIKKILSKALKLIIYIVLGFVWVCSVILFAVAFGLENPALGIILMFIPLLLPPLLVLYFAKKKMIKGLSEAEKQEMAKAKKEKLKNNVVSGLEGFFGILGALPSFIFSVVISFIIVVVIFAIIKWAFQIVF
jgi:hypothetical protein